MDHASRTIAMPRYIGFLVWRYMRDTTRAEAPPGLSGVRVVPARRNSRAPASRIATPASAIAGAIAPRPGMAIDQLGVARASAHMKTAAARATSGGGILDSSQFIR